MYTYSYISHLHIYEIYYTVERTIAFQVTYSIIFPCSNVFVFGISIFFSRITRNHSSCCPAFRSDDGSNISTPYIQHLQTASVACPNDLAGTLGLRCQDTPKGTRQLLRYFHTRLSWLKLNLLQTFAPTDCVCVYPRFDPTNLEPDSILTTSPVQCVFVCVCAYKCT